jgi:hypothetical protein
MPDEAPYFSTLDADTIREWEFREHWPRGSFPKTHCINGHPFDESNTRLYVDPKGKTQRRCRICEREHNRRIAEQRRLEK